MEYFTSNIVTSDRILYTPSSFARSSLLYLQEIGSLVANQPHTSRRSNLESYLFFLVKEGSGELVYDGVRYELCAGDCVFIDCEKAYSHTTDPENLWSLAWIHFCGENLSGIYEKYVSRGGKFVFHPGDITLFLAIHTSLFDVASSDDYIRDMRINSYLNELLTLLMAESWNPEEADDKRRSRDLLPVKRYLDEHYAEKISLDDLSDRFYINKYYLVKRFKSQYGVSVNSYLLDVRITHAKKLLRFTDKKVESIGLACGLGALTYFSRTFKKTEGISPSEYRSKWSG